VHFNLLQLTGTNCSNDARWRWTTGVAALGPDAVARIIHAIAAYDDFCHANDPYEEHDFGSFEADGQTIFFKIDLYEEPEVKDSNGEPVVNRVLTIMLADEY